MMVTLLANRRHGWITLSGALAVSITAVAWASFPGSTDDLKQDDRPSDDQSVLMRRKLDHAQRILGGLTEGRFGAVSRSARSLRELSEVSARYNLPTDDYRRFSDKFRRLTETLAERANADDLDGAVLANVQLTMNFIEYHKYVRIQTKPPSPPR